GDPSEAPHGPPLQRLAEAVIAVARRPSRAMFATQMRIIEPGWIAPMLIASIGLFVLDSVISLGIRTLLITPHATSIRYLFGTPSLRDQVINALVINPLLGVLNLAVTVYMVGALTPAERGSLNERAF